MIIFCQLVLHLANKWTYWIQRLIPNSQFWGLGGKHLKADLSNLAKWFSNNYLTLNTSIEIEVILFGGDRRLQTCQGVKLVIDHENLESEDSIKYLGVVIHKNLIWNGHIESLIVKVNQRIGLLNCIKHLLPLDARVALYNDLNKENLSSTLLIPSGVTEIILH